MPCADTIRESASRLDWTPYYRREHELHRFTPESDPYEEHRVRLAERLLADLRRIEGRWPSRVLDVGCGDGNLVRTWSRRGTMAVHGCDLSTARLGFARGRGSEPLAAARVEHLPFRAGSFDLISLVEVLEHLDDPVTALRELARVSRRYLIVTVPYDQELVVKRCPHCLHDFHLDGHIQSFDPARLRRVCAEAGLGVRALRAYTVPSRWERTAAGRLVPGAVRRTLNMLMARSRVMAQRRPKYLGVLAGRCPSPTSMLPGSTADAVETRGLECET